jgi:alkylhydroperoxidase family enzyme
LFVIRTTVKCFVDLRRRALLGLAYVAVVLPRAASPSEVVDHTSCSEDTTLKMGAEGGAEDLVL